MEFSDLYEVRLLFRTSTEFVNIYEISVSYTMLIICDYVVSSCINSVRALYGYLQGHLSSLSIREVYPAVVCGWNVVVEPHHCSALPVLNFAGYIWLYLACVPTLVIRVLLYILLSCVPTVPL